MLTHSEVDDLFYGYVAICGPFVDVLCWLGSSGEFYAQDFGPANLELISRFFEKYPEYAERTFLSVKVGFAG